MNEDHQDDEDAEMEAEIQRELDALSLDDEDADETDDQAGSEGYLEGEDTEAKEFEEKMPDCISDFIQRVQSRADDFQKELTECDSLLARVVTANEEETEEFFYQSKALKEFAFQIGEDPEELRDRVIQELAEEDEEDSRPLPIEGPGVKVLALEGPLFEEQQDSDGPLPALEGPPTDRSAEGKGKELVPTEAEKGLQVYVEPVQKFEGEVRKKVKEFEDRYENQLQQYQKDYEEGQRSSIRREKQAEEDRARRRRENDEEQRQLAQERFMYQSQIQEKLEELDKDTKESLENYQNEIKKLEARTNEERREFEEQFSHYQQKVAEKRTLSATKIQAVYRSYRARKPFMKKMRLIREDVKKKMIDKRQMEIAAEKKQEEQRRRKEKEEKKRKEEEARRKMEEEKRKQEEEKRRERERIEKERLEKERQEREEAEMRRAEEERKKKEQREMEEKANEILAKIMKEKMSSGSEGKESQTLENRSLVQPAVKVNIINSGDVNIQYANEGSQVNEVNKSVSDDGIKRGKMENKTKAAEEKGKVGEDKKFLEEESRRQMQKDLLDDEIAGKDDDAKTGRENLSRSQITETDHRKFGDRYSRYGAGNSELNSADQLKKGDGEDRKDEFFSDSGVGGEMESGKAIENLSLNLNTSSGKVLAKSVQMREKIEEDMEEGKGPKIQDHVSSPCGMETEVQFNNNKTEKGTGTIRGIQTVTVTGGERMRTRDEDEMNANRMEVKSDLKKDLKECGDNGETGKDADEDHSIKSKILNDEDDAGKEKSLRHEEEAKKKDFGSDVARTTSSNSTAKLDFHLESDGSGGGTNNRMDDEYQRVRLEWMKSSISFSKQLIQAKDHLRELEKKKRRYLRRPSAAKKMADILEEQLLAACPTVNTLSEIKTVELRDLPGCTLKTLSRCSSLRALSCHSTKIQCLEGFEQSPDICYVDVKGNELTSINCRDRKFLTFLDLRENNLSTVQGLEGCTSLKWLDLSHNRISRLSGIEYLLSLVHLNVSHNQLINGQGLSSLVHLVSLNLSNNHLSALPSLDSCVLLRTINVRGNSLSEVPVLSNHVLLTELFLDNNSLVSMETMKFWWLPRLLCLSLSQNSLQAVPVLKNAPLVKKLDLRNNYITDISSLSDGLSSLSYLEHLHIDGNPVTEEKDCRAEILKLAPSLHYLEDEALPSPASQRPLSQFEEMCLSQITAEDALRKRHSQVIQSLKRDDRYLQNMATVWSAYLDFWLKMVVDHRYMHEYGDLSPVTCEVKDLTRMIPEPDDEQRQNSEEMEQNPTTEPTVEGGAKKNLNEIYDKGASCIKTDSRGATKEVESRESLNKIGHESTDGGGAKIPLPPSSPKQTNVRKEGQRSEKSRQNAAATRIQAVWRGFEVRRDLEFHSKQYLAAVLIQSTWRGHRVRQRYLKARAALQNQKYEEEEGEEFDFNEDLDLDYLEFSEENLERGWIPSEIPEVPSSHPVLPSKHHSKKSPFQERPVSSISVNASLSPEKFAPHPPKQAWRGTNSPLAPIGNHGGVPQDVAVLSGKPPLPPVTPASGRTESLVSSTARTVRSKKEQELSEEWGFKDNITAELMMKRAKKMNQSRKKKNLDPVKKYQMFKKLQESQTVREVQHQSKRGVQRKEYFKAKEEAVQQKTKEIHRRTYEWVHSQTAYSDDVAGVGDTNQTFRSRHSSSEPSLPRMSPDMLQGRVHLTASPTIDLQSIDGSSINGVAVRGRSNSFSSPDGDRHQLPPIKTNSAPSSHIRQRQGVKDFPLEGANNTRQAWGRSPQSKKR